MNKYFDVDAYLNASQATYRGVNGSPAHSNIYGNVGLNLGVDGTQGMGAVAASPLKTPSPYQLNIANTTAGNLTCILFGQNIYLLVSNFGSSTGITVTPTQTNVNYIQLLNQSAQQPFEVGLTRVQSSNATQVTQQIGITSTDANGQSCNYPLIAQNYFSAYQFQSGIIDIQFPYRIDGGTYLTFTVLAGASLSITFFPAEKVNQTNHFSGAPALQSYAAPQVALGMPTFVQPTINTQPLQMTAEYGGPLVRNTPSSFRGY